MITITEEGVSRTLAISMDDACKACLFYLKELARSRNKCSIYYHKNKEAINERRRQTRNAKKQVTE
jgi:hypothetical protein